MAGQGRIYLSLIVATFAVAWASIFIRLGDSGPIAAAFYRMFFASIVLVIPALRHAKDSHKLLSTKERLLMVLSGLVLGLHFATWVTSLYYTSISNSVILVSTQPIWVMIMEIVFFKTKIGRKSVAGLLIALIGMFLISRGDFSLGSDHLYGDLLAVAGAIFAAIYLIIGKKMRVKLSTINYIFPVYAISAVVLLFIGFIKQENMLTFDSNTWLMFILLAIIPTVTGHSLYNWLLKYVPAHKVATTILGEPIGATILAIFFFNEVPGWPTIIGGAMILIGIYVVLLRKKAKHD